MRDDREIRETGQLREYATAEREALTNAPHARAAHRRRTWKTILCAGCERVMLQAPVDDQKEVNSHTGNTHTINNLTRNVD